MNRRERRAAASRQGRDASASRGASGWGPGTNPAAELHAQVLATTRRALAPVATGELSPARVAQLAEAATAVGESVMAHNPTSAAALACEKGCNHCCHRPVGTSAPVVLRMAAALRERLDADELAETLARVVALDERTHGRTWTPADRPPLPCAFLVDGACTIYDLRPLVCRAWNSADAAACERALGEEAVEMRFDLYRRTAFSAVEQGLQQVVGGLGLDGRDLELTAAMRVALETPDACERWLAGEPIFAGCEAKPPPGRRSLRVY